MTFVAKPFRDYVGPGTPFEISRQSVGGHEMLCWSHAPETLREVLQLSHQWPDRELIVDGDRTLTFEEHFDEVARLANALRNKFGVCKGDRVALAMRNIPEWIVAFWATVSIGGVIAPLNAFMVGSELAFCLKDTGAKVLIADHERISRIGPQLGQTSVEHIISIEAADADSGKATIVEWPEAIAGERSSLPASDIETDDAATLFYTSGTTGNPKGALSSHRASCQNLISNGMLDMVRWRGAGGTAEDFRPDLPGMTALLSIPLFHVAGCHGIMVHAMYAGRRMALLQRWNVDDALELISRLDITHLIGVPTQYVALADKLESLPPEAVPTSPLALTMGAAPPPPDLPDRLKALFPSAQIFTGYGQTECTQIATTSWNDDFLSRTKSCGAPVPIADAAILIEGDFIELPEAMGRIGELVIRSPIVATEYLNLPGATEETFGDGWLRTGDIVFVDEEGFVSIVDRAKDLIIRGGENIYSIEVEQALYAHPAVAEAAVYGRPHRFLGEEPVATVYLAPGTNAKPEELQEHVRARLARFKIPAQIWVSATPLERNANGKILKAPLRILCLEELDENTR